jgi:hypothetical protein
MRLGTFQFLDRLPGRVSAKVNASAHCPRKRPDTRGLRPRRTPELARAFEPTLILRAGRLHRPAAQPFIPPLRPPIVPPLLVLPQIDHPLRAHRFAARNRPPPARAPSPPVSSRGDRSPQEGRSPPRPAPHSGGKPPQSMRWGDFEGTSEVAKRLECASLLALSKSNSALGDLPAQTCLPQTTEWVAHPTTLSIRGPGSTPARW